MLVLAMFAAFLLAVAAMIAGAVGALRLAGMAMNRNRGRGERARLAILALCSVLVSPLAAVGGFSAIAGLFYFAQTAGGN